LVGILVGAVVLINVGLFRFGTVKEFTYSDASLSAKLLSYHSSLNSALYAKENTLRTTISQDGLIAHAYADTTLAALTDGTDVSTAANDSNATDEDATFSDNIMVKPNPDSVQGLVSKQVQIYESQGGDTLSSIAQKFNISVNTIKWANNLPSDTVKPGWYLKILPRNGVLYQVDSNDTLPDIANYFHGNMDTIIAYNGLANAEDIDAGQWLIIPDGTVPPPPAPAPAPTSKPVAKVATRTKAGTPVIVHNGSGHSFPWGYCTYYVSTRRKITFGGNAKAWLSNAKAAGYATGSTPAVGAVMVTTESRAYGHVAYVEEVSGGKVKISEMNYSGFGKVDTRWLDIGSGVIRGYIY
jgi:surface antigen